jgi:hypothetical protein
MAEFVERRRRETIDFGQAAGSAAREALGEAARSGRRLTLSTQSAVDQFGADVLRKASNGFRGASKPEFLEAAVKTVVERGAQNAGAAAGIVRGGVHAVEGIAEGGAFLGRLANPTRHLQAGGSPEVAQIAGAVKKGATYVRKAVGDPEVILRDGAALGRRMRTELDPGATPEATTLEGEIARRFDIGMNQGELVFDVGTAGIGGPAAKSMKGFGALSRGGRAEKYLAQGFDEAKAAYLAQPYPASGMGSHYIPRRFGLPEWFTESEFNVLKPEGISRGDMYELHYKVDPGFYGAGLEGRTRGGGWSGKRLGLERYGPAGRIWHGAPAPLKARVGGSAATLGGISHEHVAEEDER